jgi:hypothetical protein
MKETSEEMNEEQQGIKKSIPQYFEKWIKNDI